MPSCKVHLWQNIFGTVASSGSQYPGLSTGQAHLLCAERPDDAILNGDRPRGSARQALCNPRGLGDWLGGAKLPGLRDRSAYCQECPSNNRCLESSNILWLVIVSSRMSRVWACRTVAKSALACTAGAALGPSTADRIPNNVSPPLRAIILASRSMSFTSRSLRLFSKDLVDQAHGLANHLLRKAPLLLP